MLRRAMPHAMPTFVAPPLAQRVRVRLRRAPLLLVPRRATAVPLRYRRPPPPACDNTQPPSSLSPSSSFSSPSPSPSPPSSSSSPPPPPLPPPPAPLSPAAEISLRASAALTAAALLLPTVLAEHDLAHGTANGVLEALAAYNSHFEMVALIALFAALHSGLAALRAQAVQYVGERAFRVLFAATSLPAAGVLLMFFVAHRYDGVQLVVPSLQTFAVTRPLVWWTTMVSFLFLYPATFNLLEVAAVKLPSQRLYEQGIARVTRHPQLVGQVLWGVAHTAWLGSSFALVTSLCLVAHHAFAVWHGDRRLRARYGDDVWAEYERRTSVVPFAAVVDGRQTLEWREFLRPAYVGVIVATLAFYAAHPWMERLAFNVNF